MAPMCIKVYGRDSPVWIKHESEIKISGLKWESKIVAILTELLTIGNLRLSVYWRTEIAFHSF
jgi:hypothetical protein